MLLAYAGQGLGLVVSCAIRSRLLALVATPLAIAPFILFTPYAVNEDDIQPWFRPVQVASPFWVSQKPRRTIARTNPRAHAQRDTHSLPFSVRMYGYI